MTIKENVARLAKERNVSLLEVEREAGLVERSTYRWNRQAPSIDKVCKVAKVLGVTVDELVKDVDFRSTR